MKDIADLLFEAKILKDIPRTGYAFLGAGSESVAAHSFNVTFIAYVMCKLVPEADSLRLISMCLLHDLAEARIGDHNYVHKRYVTPDEEQAVADATQHLPFGSDMADLIAEFNARQTLESQLAYDADQLSFIMDLKAASDIGHHGPEKWMPSVENRLKTEIGKRLAQAINNTRWDEWWIKDYAE